MRIRFRRALAAAASGIAVLAVFPASGLAAPSITSFTPTQGALGTSVTITGSGFTGATSVKFGGVAATTFSVVSDTSVTATVPTLAKTGTITVTAPSGTATSAATFKVLPGISISRTVGPPTTALTISGSGFAANEPLDIYEGATDVVVASTDAGGTFSGVPITIPVSAPPGALWISAVGRRSLSAAQTSFTVRTDWLNLRGEAGGSGWNPYENVIGPGNVNRLQLAWTTAGSWFANVPPGVVVASKTIVALEPHLGTLVAVNTEGKQVWSQTLASNFFSGPAPADGSGVLVAAATDGKVHAYTLSSGAPKWTTAGPSDTGGGSPVIVGSDVIVPAATQLEDFNLTTGALKWAVAASCASTVSTPAVAAGNILYTCRDSSGNALLNSVSTTGALHNVVSPTEPAGATSAPAIEGGNVYTLLGGQLESRSFSGFYQKWAVTSPVSAFSDTVAGDGIVVVCGSGGIFVVNAADGSTRFSNSAYPCTADAAIANGVIYEPQDGDVAMFDEYGDALGRLASGAATGAVAVADGSVYTAESISGIDRWSIPAPATTARVRRNHGPDVRRLHPNLALKPYHRQHRR